MAPALNHLLTVHRGTYKDSVRQMAATRAILEAGGVEWAGVFMATPANLRQLEAEGFAVADLDARANDLILAVRAEDGPGAQRALTRAEASLFAVNQQEVGASGTTAKDLRTALREDPAANVALISVPGSYAALEAHKALSAGLHVVLFSDGVSLAEERQLKERGEALGLIVMGPSAGTAQLRGVGLGFANHVRSGPVGIVAASGTGTQELMCLLDQMGIGTSSAIGVGGNDLTAEIGGLSTAMALDAFEDDEATTAIALVSKQADPDLAASLLDRARKPIVAVLLGTQDTHLLSHDRVYTTFEQAAVALADLLGAGPSEPADGELMAQVEGAIARLSDHRTRLVGLFSGGTLCEEAAFIASRYLGPVEHRQSELSDRHAHVFLDLGDEEHTRGRPHPMIDVDARSALLLEQARDPSVAVVMFDVVIGEGAHPDPASVLAPAAARIVESGAIVVVRIVGTPTDPQDVMKQRRQLELAGCIIAPSNARAAYVATAIVLRNLAVAFETRAAIS